MIHNRFLPQAIPSPTTGWPCVRQCAEDMALGAESGSSGSCHVEGPSNRWHVWDTSVTETLSSGGQKGGAWGPALAPDTIEPRKGPETPTLPPVVSETHKGFSPTERESGRPGSIS